MPLLLGSTPTTQVSISGSIVPSAVYAPATGESIKAKFFSITTSANFQTVLTPTAGKTVLILAVSHYSGANMDVDYADTDGTTQIGRTHVTANVQEHVPFMKDGYTSALPFKIKSNGGTTEGTIIYLER